MFRQLDGMKAGDSFCQTQQKYRKPRLNRTQRHHYVPQFYLREWHDSDGEGFWLYYRDRNQQLRLRRRPAKSVAYLDNLYALVPDGLSVSSSTEPDLVETEFLSKVDHHAAKAHEKLLRDGLNSLDDKERSSFAVFLNSLMLRHPTEMEKLTKQAEKLYQAHQRRHLNKVDQGIVRNTVLRTMVELILEPRRLRHLLAMRWGVVTIPFEEEHFLTSDSPILVNGAIASPDAPITVLSIALSPKKLLILHLNDPEFDEEFVRKVAVIHSPLIAERAEKHLISSRRIKNGRFMQYEKVLGDMFGIG